LQPQQRRAPPTEWEDELEPAFVSFTDEDEEEEEEDGSPNKKRYRISRTFIKGF
jgi:hypothetical protein